MIVSNRVITSLLIVVCLTVGCDTLRPGSDEYTVNVSVDGSGDYSIVPEKEMYEEGDVVTIQVEPAEDWYFAYWEGSREGAEHPLELTVDEDISVTAVLDDSPFDGGDGSEEYPYKISTVDQLQDIKSYKDSHFLQIKDINASETASWNNGLGFRPIGRENAPFKGRYDGNGFSISRLTIDRDEDQVGLFGFMGKKEKDLDQSGSRAEIKNVKMENVRIAGSRKVGGIAGKVRYGDIRNSSIEGVVKGSYEVGGVVGYIFKGNIKESDFKGSIGGSEGGIKGGLVGTSGDVRLTNSFASADIPSGGNDVGGLVGEWAGGYLIENCYATGNVDGTYHVGGLIGNFASSIIQPEMRNSYAMGNVTATLSHSQIKSSAGGLVGKNKGTRIMNSYALGDVEGVDAVGGLVGMNRIGINEREGRIMHSYAAGKVSGNSEVGGLVGYNKTVVDSSYWDVEASGIDEGVGKGDSTAVRRLTTTQMTGSNAQDHMSWFNWQDTWETTADYPILQWQNQ